MRKPSRQAEPLAAFVADLIGETVAARGLGEASLIADWPEIVGEELARYARPIQLQWPPRGAKRDPEGPAAPATLVLRVDSAFALEIQHAADVLVARVNGHLGWRCVDRIAFRQGPLPTAPRRKLAIPPPSPEAEAEAGALAAPIEDEALRAALTRLGARAIDGAAARRRAAKGEPSR